MTGGPIVLHAAGMHTWGIFIRHDLLLLVELSHARSALARASELDSDCLEGLSKGGGGHVQQRELSRGQPSIVQKKQLLPTLSFRLLTGNSL